MTDPPRTTTEAATPDHFEAVHQRLLHPLNPEIDEAVWRRLFDQPWARPDDLLGQVLLADDTPVGYAGFIHGRMPRSDGSDQHLCNLTSWVVDPEYRHAAVSLIMPLLRMKETTVTSLTNIAAVPPVLARLGFEELESARCLLRPTLRRRRGWNARETLVGFDEVHEALPAAEQRIAEAHRDLGEHVVLRGSDGKLCYAMVTRGRWRRIPTARLRWITPGVLAEVAPALLRALRRHLGAILLEVDARHVPEGMPGVMRRELAVPRMFRSSGMRPVDVQDVYSEFVLLGL